MSRHLARALSVLTAAAFVVGAAPDADAGKTSRSKSAEKSKKSKKKAKKKAKKRSRQARASKRRSNMPAGWSWPPSRAMKQVGDGCLAQLDELGIKWEKGKRTRKIATPVVVPDMMFGGVKLKPTFRKPPFTMDCHLALGLETYGKQLYALGVREIKFSSIYRYDTVQVNGARRKSLSRHALGLAMDIKSVVDAAGHEAVVLDDYPDGNELLLNIEQLMNDSGGFRTVLTPRNDPESHDDHFHVEIKVDYSVPVGRKPSS